LGCEVQELAEFFPREPLHFYGNTQGWQSTHFQKEYRDLRPRSMKILSLIEEGGDEMKCFGAK